MAAATGDTTEETMLVPISGESARLMALINESRRKSLDLSDPIIEDINNRTVRVITGLVAEKNEFRDRRRIPIKKGTNYHTHYTSDNDEIYMTLNKHGVFSKIIYPIDKQKSLIGYYNTLNQQSPMVLKSKVTTPNIVDYGVGMFNRFFARKTNDERKIPFEIAGDDMNTSPLYDYINISWYLTGTPESVELANRRRTELAVKQWPNIGGLLNPFQYYRKIIDQTPEEIMKDRLGIVDYSEMERTTISTGTIGAGLMAKLTGGGKKSKRKKSKKTKSKS